MQKPRLGRGFWVSGPAELDERLGGFDRALDDVASLVDGILDMATSALDGLFGLFAKVLCLFLEVVGGVFEIVACVFDSLAELLAGFDPGLGSVEKSDGRSCGDADAEGEPVVFCAHFDSTSCLNFLILFPTSLDSGPLRLVG